VRRGASGGSAGAMEDQERLDTRVSLYTVPINERADCDSESL
jgi:hypothetical protein